MATGLGQLLLRRDAGYLAAASTRTERHRERQTLSKAFERQPRGGHAIVITNGQHCAFGNETATTKIGDRDLGDARFDYIGRQIAWLDRWLKDNESAPPPTSPITVSMSGVNRWADFNAVPWAGRDPSRVFYLSSDGRANTVNGNGRLLDAPPAAATSDTFTYDPARPIVAHGGEISGVGTDQESNDGAFDQRPIEAREDVLVYTSGPLPDDTLPVVRLPARDNRAAGTTRNSSQ